MPSPSALRTFEAAARLGSFKEAARELAVTPTAVSHQIRALEEQLGITLFVRRIRAVELTDAGERLADATRGAFQQIALALEEIAAAESVLTVSTTPAFATLWLVPRIGGFELSNPGIRVQIDTTTTPVDLERDRRVDVAIRYGALEHPRLRAQVLVTERVGVYAVPDYLRRLDRLEDAAFIETAWQRRGLAALSWSAWARAAGLDGEVVEARIRRFDQEHHAVQAALAGQGLLLVSSLLVADTVARGWLAPYRPEISITGMSYAALWAPAHASSRKIARFLAWLSSEIDASGS
jgi:DNA-binding transcriptional LysR family regulator